MNTLPANVVVWSQLPRDSEAYDLTDRDAQRALVQAETRHFWFLSRNRFIARHLARLAIRPPARLLELGCGGGAVLAHLSQLGYDVTGIDGHLERVLTAAERAPSARLIVHDLSEELPPLEGAPFDAVALFDVIEHLDEPGKALESALEHVVPGGWLVGTVPAMRALWSEVDGRSGHRLRYERDDLVRVLGTLKGTDEAEVVSFHRTLVPLLWLQRKLARHPRALETGLAVPPRILNAALLQTLLLEQRLERLLRPVPGASLWFAARRSRS
jgi:SAM-dependent methyltransferase